jgi:hypothetical protein
MSYAFLDRLPDADVGRWLADPRFEILLDCGAFSAFNAGKRIDLDDYVRFVQKWEKHLHGYMALDVVQDPAGTERNLKIMLDRGLKPIPVHVFGDEADRMDELFSLSHWVALAGLRRPHRGHAPKTYIKEKMSWARGRQVHWLGYTREPMLLRYKPYSCDCASWKAGFQFGAARVYLGRGKWVSATFENAGTVLDDMRMRSALAHYGIPRSAFLDPASWRHPSVRPESGRWPVPRNDTAIAKLNTRSWVRYVLEFLERFDIRVYLACDPSDYSAIDDALGWAA